jgi:peptidoglycan/xylan/chitin deacetylase (PgdA/CDA1 family)
MKRRALLAGAFAAAAGSARADTTPGENPAVVPVLTYHRFDPLASHSGTVVTAPVFAEQMAYLATKQVRVAPLRNVLAIAHGTALSGPTVAITADDGWRTVYTEMFPIIREHRFPVTLFINPPMIGHGGAYLTWPMITEMVKSGLVDVQAHTLHHPNFNTERARRDPASYQAFVKTEIAGCRAPITEALGLPADMLAWPYGIHNATLEAAARDAGYIAAFTLGSRPLANGDADFALPRLQIYDTDREPRFGWIVAGHPRQQLKKVVS